MDYKNKTKSINMKLISAFTIIMVLTIISIRVFVNISFESEFKKYVDDSNKAEINHLMFDLKKVYSDNHWDVETIKELGEDAIRKGIALEVYDKDNTLIWSVFEDEKVLSNDTLKKISDNMQSIDDRWNNKFKKYKVPLYNENGNIVGYPYIGHYESTYYMENDMKFFNSINRFMVLIAFISIGGIIVISIVISKSISKPINKVSKMTKVIEEGNYKNKIDYKSNIKEVDQLIESINKLANVLSEQENLRKRLTTDIAHELRTPLTSIKGHLDVIIAGIWEPTNERLISINEEVERLISLVNNLINLSEFDCEKNRLRYENVNLKDLIKNILYNYESKALQKNIKINYELEDVKVYIDKNQLSQVIVNLISNAIKFTNENGEIFIRIYTKENYINILIKDTGIGIPKKDISYIFERFYRVDESRSKITGGIGVGLAIAKSIVIAHKGDITVNSKVDEGTEFIIKLPKN